MTLLRWTYVLVLAAAVLVMLWRGYWRRFPAFVAYSAAGLTFMLVQDLPTVRAAPWLHWQYVQNALRAACCVEILWALLIGMSTRDRVTLIICLLGLPFGMFLLADFLPETPIYIAAQNIRHIEAGLAASILLAIPLGWGLNITARRGAKVHGLLFAVLMINQVVGLALWSRMPQPVSYADWEPIMRITYFVAILCYGCWFSLAVSAALQVLRPVRSIHQPHDERL